MKNTNKNNLKLSQRDNKYYIFSKFINFNNLILVLFILIMIYYFFNNFSNNLTGLYTLIIAFSLSLIVNLKYKYSEIWYIRIFESIMIYTIISFIIMIIFGVIFILPEVHAAEGDGLNSSNNADHNNNNSSSNKNNTSFSPNNLNVNQVSEKTGERVYNVKADFTVKEETIKNLADAAKNVLNPGNILGGLAGGKAGAATIKTTVGMPLGPRALVIATTTGAATFGGKIGYEVANAVKDNQGLMNNIAKSHHANPDVTRVPSPGNDPFNPFINCPLESANIPIEILIKNNFIVSILLLVLFISLIYVIFNRFIFKSNINFIKVLIKKLPISNDKIKKLELKLDNKLVKLEEINSNWLLILFSITCCTFIFILALNIYISFELYSNLDDYITVYNYLKGK